MNISRKGFLACWLVAAGVVVALRISRGISLGYDLAIQLQAAQNLISGHGLTIFSLEGGEDVSSPKELILLTYFPAGYSLCAAALIALGIGTPMVVPVLGAIGTILGWWGWARMAWSLMSRGIQRGGLWQWIALAIGISAPLLFTPRWTGTDVFLWSALPWALQWLVPPDLEIANRTRLDLLTGAICGFAVLMRYEALFLAGYCALIILFQSGKKPKELFWRAGAFGLGLFSFLAIQIYLNYFASHIATAPGGFTLGTAPMNRSEVVRLGFLNLTSANFPLVWWLPGKVIPFFLQPGPHAPWLLALTLAGFVLVPILIAMRAGTRDLSSASNNILLVAAGLFVAVPLFLWACALGGRFYITVQRYYLPLLPLAVLIAYPLAIPGQTDRSALQRWFAFASGGYLIAYVCVTLYGVLSLLIPGDTGAGKRERLLGMRPPYHWFSGRPVYMFSESRRYVADLLKADSHAILVTNRENWFYADPTIDQTRLHRFDHFKSRYISGPVHLLIMVADPFPTADTNLYWFQSNGQVVRSHDFETVPDLHLLRRFPEEEIKVLEAAIPDGTKIELKRPQKKSQ